MVLCAPFVNDRGEYSYWKKMGWRRLRQQPGTSGDFKSGDEEVVVLPCVSCKTGLFFFSF